MLRQKLAPASDYEHAAPASGFERKVLTRLRFVLVPDLTKITARDENLNELAFCVKSEFPRAGSRLLPSLKANSPFRLSRASPSRPLRLNVNPSRPKYRLVLVARSIRKAGRKRRGDQAE